MNLSDLFVSHKQVTPVSFSAPEMTQPKDIYVNFDRAQKAASEETPQTDAQETDNMYGWKVQGSDEDGQYQGWGVATYEKEENNPIIPYRPGVTPDAKPKSSLSDYRNSEDYTKFKSELDKFIQNNSQYASIKDSLDYLAALESRYRMNAENYQGSKALGWFQFMDSTRAPYNKQTRQQFANDSQAQLMAAAKYYTDLQNRVKNWGGDPNDFVTMYGAWWRPESARQYIQNGNHNHKTIYNEDFQTIRQRAKDLIE